MHQQTFSTTIDAPKETVWSVLWSDETFRDWASIIDEGTYLAGEMKEGNTVQFISSVNGYGVTSFIEKCVPNELVLFRHQKDTKDHGEGEREDEWSGGTERYVLEEKDDVTTLTLTSEIPPELKEIFEDRTPKALARIKVLAEGKE